MSLALLVGASPKRSVGGPVIWLSSGTWVIKTNGLVDTQLILQLDEDIHEIHDEYKFLVHDRARAKVSFRERGTEDSIDVFISRVA